MKIVQVVYSMEMGGAESIVAQLCRLQRANGHSVSVAAYSNLGSLGEALRADGFRVDVLGLAPVPRTMLRYLQLFRELRPDAVHCHNPAPTLQAALSARLAGVRKVISTRHSLVAPPYDVSAEVKYSLVALACNQVVGICEATCANLRNAPLAPRRRIVRIYNGAAPLEIPPAGTLPQANGFTFLYVGRLAAIKDLPTLLRAFALAVSENSNIRLWIVGDGAARSELEALANALGVSAQVTFWGERQDVARFFAAADVFTMSSVSEGLPMSLLQAMSAGLPILVTDVGGMAEVVRLSGSGLCVPVGDSASMAAAMLVLAGGIQARETYSRNGLDAYQNRFTLEHMNEEYMHLYGA